MKNEITSLFGIQYPVIQGGMIWCSGWKLASAVSEAGGLGLLGSGSMHPDTVRDHIRKTKLATNKAFGVNVPLIYPNIEEIMQIIQEEKVPIVFTSAGNPKTWTGILKSQGIKVAHVIANSKFIQKCDDAEVDAIVVEGFEAGGHNGREETTTLALLQSVSGLTKTPIIAAGGIGSGRAILAAMALGAKGVQIGSLFAASLESSAHPEFKNQIVHAAEGSTKLTLKQLTPVRLIRNEFFNQVEEMERQGASLDAMNQLLGKGRAKLGMFEGNTVEGELEIGQIAAIIKEIKPVSLIMQDLINQYNTALEDLKGLVQMK